ncbi:nephrin-like, partial [Pollicipes pollicipes]|uniref:nephrin-like n=1 Tax=Pollicipes pollicipes TaxID=41117 RepID=UPI001884F839
MLGIRLHSFYDKISFDARGERAFSEGSVERDLFRGARALFVTDRQPPALRLDTLGPGDEALYRCRVDFKLSPTRNQRVNLTVIVPPDRPVILHAAREVSGTLGPLEEGAPLQLTCRSDGGRPTPVVTWTRDGRLLNLSSEPSGHGSRVSSELHLPPLSRADLHTRLECAASNTNASRPISNHVVVDINFRPLSVEILGSSLSSMSSEVSYDLLCRTHGSRPPANISWWIGDKRLTDATQMADIRGNMSSSSLTFRPSASDHGRPLICRARNDYVTDGVMDDRHLLNIRYAPRVTLRLGYALDPKDIKEGVDVYFECDIEANPGIYSVKWTHEGEPVEASAQSGVSDMVSINER